MQGLPIRPCFLSVSPPPSDAVQESIDPRQQHPSLKGEAVCTSPPTTHTHSCLCSPTPGSSTSPPLLCLLGASHGPHLLPETSRGELGCSACTRLTAQSNWAIKIKSSPLESGDAAPWFMASLTAKSPGFGSQNHKSKTRTTVSWPMIRSRSDAAGTLDSPGSSLTVGHRPRQCSPPVRKPAAAVVLSHLPPEFSTGPGSLPSHRPN